MLQLLVTNQKSSHQQLFQHAKLSVWHYLLHFKKFYTDTILKDVVQREFVPVNIKNDSQGAIAFAKDPINHMKSKHIDIRYYFIRDPVYQSNEIMIEYVHRCNQMKTWLMYD